MSAMVTALAEFDKYPDLLTRYFGPPSPKRLTTLAAIVQPGPVVAGRGVRGDQVGGRQSGATAAGTAFEFDGYAYAQPITVLRMRRSQSSALCP
jgi:hypothetical protein